MENKKYTSLRDIARELGVSAATVSRALHGSKEISRGMRERVQLLAKQMNYRPNPFPLKIPPKSSMK